VTTWVDGAAETTVDGASGRPIGFGIDKVLKFPKGTYETTFELVGTPTKIYYFCPSNGGTLKFGTVTAAEVATAKMGATTSLSNWVPANPEDYGLPACNGTASNATVTTDSGHVCMCDRGTFFCANSATAYSPMLSPVEIGVVVICVFIVCMVAICMCAFAAKKTSMKQAEAVPPPPPDYA
jgi:ABC-type antimicrobial peptide transport system permease subunit